jgi:hypothetical protein
MSYLSSAETFQVNANLSTMQGVPYTVCNPFSAPPEYQYQPDKCPANTIQIGEIPQVCQREDQKVFVAPNIFSVHVH